MQHIIGIAMILAGALIMLFSIFETRNLLVLTPFLPRQGKEGILRSLRLHRCLMIFFLLAYLAVATAFFYNINQFGELFVGIVFLFGAIFVLTGIRIQIRMLLETKNSLHGLLPICSSCKKIRNPDADPHDPASWTSVEKFISAKTSADFTHSVCPDCLKKLYPELYK
ncbi:hypothetical protein ACUUL3_13635 [Thiovibrio sp. JS02]